MEASVPALVATGAVPNASLAAESAATVKLLDVAAVSLPSVKVSEDEPAVLGIRSLKVATPFTAVAVSVPPMVAPVGPAIATTTFDTSALQRLPNLSSTLTTIGSSVSPAVRLDGPESITSFAAAAGFTLNAEDFALVST